MGETALDFPDLSEDEFLKALALAREQNQLKIWWEQCYGSPTNPHPDWQKRFYDAGAYAQQRLLMAANGCITPWTVVETVPRSRRIVDILGQAAPCVRSWDGESECVAPISRVFLKSIEPAFRVLTDTGFFDCTAEHRLLTDDGWMNLGQLIRLSSGLRWTQTTADFLASCGTESRRGGRSLLLVSGSDLSPLPLQADAQELALFLFEQRDAAERISRHSYACHALARTATDDSAARIAVLCGLFADPAPYIDALRMTSTHQGLAQFANASGQPQSGAQGGSRQFSSPGADWSESFVAAYNPELLDTTVRDCQRFAEFRSCSPPSAESLYRNGRISILYPLQHPELVGGSRIKAIVPLGYQPILDLTVETGCYYSGGVIHSNTGKSQTICAELAAHVTGDYPDWWQGHRFSRGGWEAWVGSIDANMQKIGPQRALLGRDLDTMLGTGLIPRHAIVNVERRQAGVKDVADTVVIKHASGENIVIVFKTYEQGWRKWQSGDPKVILWDEEPDDSVVDQKDILSETLTRLVRNSGIWIVGYTPLLGQTNLTEHFMLSNDPGVFYTGATWDDAPHMSKEDRDRIEKQYKTDAERDARARGVPMLGEGRIFTTPEQSILIEPIQIPDHWARIIGIDFGGVENHPHAIACLAIDRDTGIHYLYDVWKEQGKTRDHAHAINARGDWIPVAWPHDGMQHDRGSGQRLHKNYRDEYKVNMLAKSARYKTDEGGAQPQWPIIETLRDLLDAGKFKVFRTCQPWLQEYRSYHMKDGKIVAKRDDALKASFYALMMRRFARSRYEGNRMPKDRQPAPFRVQ